MTPIEWTSNATVYSINDYNELYLADLVVSYGHYEKGWKWNVTAGLKDATHPTLHEYGTVDTVEEAKDKASEVLENWKIKAGIG